MIRVSHFILDIIALVWAMTLLLLVLRISGDYFPSVRKQVISGKNIHVREYHFRRYKNTTRNNEKTGATFASEVVQRRGLGCTDE